MKPSVEVDVEGALQRLFQPRTHLNVWQWAERHVVLSPRVTPHPGPYRTDWCPYVREPQEAFTDPSVRDIVLCWAARSSKTETALNMIRYSIAHDPQPTMIVMPSEKLARSFSETRFQPSIDDCPLTAGEKPPNPDQFKLLEMHFKRCTVWLTGANSPANLKGRGVTILMCDEIDTWPQGSEKETGALQQVLERTKDRWNRKHILTSTPTVETGQIWREFLLGDQRYYFVPCPHCGFEQTLKMKQLRWPEEAKRTDGHWDLTEVKIHTWYECESCSGRITDQNKPGLLTKGRWKSTATHAEPGRRSYHLSSLYPSWISFAEVACMFLQAKNGPEDLQRFANSWLAEPFLAYGNSQELQQQLEKLKVDNAVEGVPGGYKAIMTVDVQATCLFFVVRAHNPAKESILLEYGTLPGFDEAAIVARKRGVLVVFVDSAYPFGEGHA